MDLTPLPEYQVVIRRDGRQCIRLLDEPQLEPFVHKDTWSAKDAVTIVELMAKWTTSPYGLLDLVREINRGGKPTGPNVTLKGGADEQRRRAALYRSRNFMLTLADREVAQMAEAAAFTAPDLPLTPNDFPAPAGIVIFKDRYAFSDLIEQIGSFSGDVGIHMRRRTHCMLRAIQWLPNGPGTGVIITLLVDGSDMFLENERDTTSQIQPPGTHKYLSSVVRGVGIFDSENAPDEVNSPSYLLTVKLLRSIFAIASSPNTEEKTHLVSHPLPRKRKRGSTPKRRSTSVRVVSLRNPEHAQYEHDAATGRKLRAHWVRGHWRQQWYATAHEHRTIWVDGFIRGDASLGVVSGPKLHRATPPN